MNRRRSAGIFSNRQTRVVRNRKVKTFLIFTTFMGLFGPSLKALETGSQAPLVSGIDQNGESIQFADTYAKGTTLVFFYPKADTPGCTAQACSLRDSFAELQGKNLQILGVSRDSAASQKKFQEKYHLPFTLVADADGRIAEAFGVGGVMGLPVSKRQSFLIRDGKIVWMTPSAQTGSHAREVQAALDTLP